MKKSSLLAISLASLVGLVSCGKESGAASPKDLDAKVAKIVYNYATQQRPDALTALLYFSMTQTVEGYIMGDDGNPLPEGTNKVEFECHIAYNTEELVWSVDEEPSEEAGGWTEETIALAQELIDQESRMQFASSDLVYLCSSSVEYDEEKGKFICTYFQDFKETLKEYGIKLVVSTSPLGWGYSEGGSGLDEETQAYNYQYKASNHYAYNSKGFMTSYVDKYSQVNKGVSDSSLDGKYSSKVSVKVKYLTYAEPEL